MLATADDALLDAGVFADVLPDGKSEHAFHGRAAHMPRNREINVLDLVQFSQIAHHDDMKHRHRERYALDFVTLVIRVPKDNEIKIDAAEQMFASLYSIKKGVRNYLPPLLNLNISPFLNFHIY